MKIKVVIADIATVPVEVIVNAANEFLRGGGGVDGAIHRAAGPGLLEECRELNRCPVGEVALTRGHNLPAKYVIHAIGPRWQDGKQNEAGLLASCYRRSIQMAESLSALGIAFPAISTGIFRFPSDLAANIAVKTVLGTLDEPSSLREIIFCCFSDSDLAAYERVIADQLSLG